MKDTKLDVASGDLWSGRLFILAGFIVVPVKGLQLPGQILDIDFQVPLAHAHAIADKELEKIVEELHHLTGEMMELFFGNIILLALKIP